MTTNLEAATKALYDNDEDACEHSWVFESGAVAALDAIDPRLKLLTPEDTTAILDWMTKFGAFWLRSADGYSVLPAHVWEVLL